MTNEVHAMTKSPLTKMRVAGYKSLKSVEVELRDLNVMIGPNGVGKSNFISLFELLNKMMDGQFQNAIARGGGANAFLHFGQKVTDCITLELTFGKNGYHCKWAPTQDGSLFFGQESPQFQGADHSKPFNQFLGSRHFESKLLEKPLKPVSEYVRDSLRRWKAYHFHDTSNSAHIKQPGAINDDFYLRPDGENLAAYLFKIKCQNPDRYEMIRNTVRRVTPFFDDFILRPMSVNEDRIRLEWRQRDSDYPFLAHQLSDGTLRFMCLATLLLQPELPSLILIDEPELGLHPFALNLLAGLLRSASKRTQIIVATQSVQLVNEFELSDLLVVEHAQGETLIRRLDAERFSAWLEDYTLGELWNANVLGGRPH
jgi:predicted ATPase